MTSTGDMIGSLQNLRLLHYVPYKSKSMSVNPDPRTFPFAIVCCYCNIYRNTLMGMRIHLDECPHRYKPRILCGHCEMTVDDWRDMVKHLNVKGRLSEEPCDLKYKVVPLRTPTFSEKPMPPQTHTLQKLGKSVKSDSQVRLNVQEIQLLDHLRFGVFGHIAKRGTCLTKRKSST